MDGIAVMMDRNIAPYVRCSQQRWQLVSTHRHVINICLSDVPSTLVALVDSHVASGPRQLRCRQLPHTADLTKAGGVARLICPQPDVYDCALSIPNGDLNLALLDCAWQHLAMSAATPSDCFSQHVQQHLQCGIATLLSLLRNTESLSCVALDDAVCGLLGLGLGLTPSGDDFLSGLLVALHLPSSPMSQHLPALQDSVSRHLSRTNPISAAFIQDALSAQVNRPVQQFINVLYGHETDEQRMMSAIAGVTAFGHSSGFDVLSGILSGLPFSHNRSILLCPYIVS